MQSCTLLPPPPGKLTPELPPLPTVVDKGTGNDSGATPPTRGAGAPITDAEGDARAGGGVGTVLRALRLEAGMLPLDVAWPLWASAALGMSTRASSVTIESRFA
jgi:hypothetical protein